VTWAISVPILVFLGLLVLDLGPMYATDRRQTKVSLNASALGGRKHNNATQKGQYTKKRMVIDMTDRAWFSRLLQHPATKWSGSIPEPAWGPSA